MTNVVILPPGDQWDQTQLLKLFNNDEWLPVNPFDFKILNNFDGTQGSEGVVLVIPGRYWDEKVDEINEWIKDFNWLLIIVTGDEDAVFPIEKITHSNCKFWIQTPKADKDYGDARMFGVGYSPEFSNKSRYLAKHIDLFLSAQNTHIRRQQCFEAIEDLHGGGLDMVSLETEGFTQGLEPKKYRNYTAKSKFIPCPSGAISPDSFRLYEALESGCIPIADDVSPTLGKKSHGYWLKLFPDAPFPIIYEWSALGDLIKEMKPNWKHHSNKIFAWWQGQKRKYAYDLIEDLSALGSTDGMPTGVEDKITVLITSSVIPAHPSTKMIDETIATIRHHLPLAEILILFDGIREEQEGRRKDYEEYKRRMLWKCNNQYQNVLPIVFESHLHQANMVRESLDYVKTDNLLFIEADTPLVIDREIEWKGLIKVLENDRADLIRFYAESHILEPHKHLMVGEPQTINAIRLQKTIQFSGRPHLARVQYYRKFLEQYFPPDCKTWTEDVMHGVCQAEPWEENRLFIYLPTDQAQFSYDLDGRKDDTKYPAYFGAKK